MMRKARAVLVLLLRVLVPCTLVAPLAMLVGRWMGGMVERPWEGIFDLEEVASVGTMLGVVALVIGLPVARWVVSSVSGYWWRTLLITVIGGVIPTIIFLPYAFLAAPPGMLAALACCLFNADRLREEQPRLLVL